MLRLDFNLVIEIFNFIVLFLLLRHFLIRPVTNIMDKRQEMIAQSMGNARDLESQAAEQKDRYEEKMKHSEEGGQQIVAQAKENAKVQYDRIVKEASDKADGIIKNARQEAEADQDKAMREAQNQIAGLVIAAAAKVIRGESSAEGNQALYDKYIAEAGDAHDAGSL